MSGTTNAVSPQPAGPPVDRRARRRAETRAEIVEAAWDLARAEGLAGLSLRELGARVGMRAQSLYSYFGSKDDIHDAMFRQGYEQFLEWMAPVADASPGADPTTLATLAVRRFFDFCVSDPVRHQLLFQRTIPGFEPSAESYAVAVEALGRLADGLARLGIDDPADLDLWTAVSAGLVGQQIANDPGGDRWERLIDRAVHMLLTECSPGASVDRRSGRTT